jgi:hypothetical protein
MQTSYQLAPDQLKLGMLSDASPRGKTNSRLCATPVKAGYGVFRAPFYGEAGGNYGSDPGAVWQVPSPVAALDADAITVAGTSATGTSTLADGVVGTAEMQPARKLTITFDASTDWDATTGTISFYNEDDVLVTENVAIATSTSVTTTDTAKQFVSFTKPAQTGTGGAYTIGIAALDASITESDFEGVALFRPTQVAYSETADFGPEEMIACVRRNGAVIVATEGTPAEGDPVYVGTGVSNLGKFRNDNTSAVLVTGARFGRCLNASNLAEVEF